jgi:hypothetical protein
MLLSQLNNFPILYSLVLDSPLTFYGKNMMWSIVGDVAFNMLQQWMNSTHVDEKVFIGYFGHSQPVYLHLLITYIMGQLGYSPCYSSPNRTFSVNIIVTWF